MSKRIRVTDKSVLQSPMTLLTQDAKVAGLSTNASSPTAYLINHNAENTLMTLRFKAEGFEDCGCGRTI